MTPTERCGYHFDHDPVTLLPTGRRCDRPATQCLHWEDGRTSVCCAEHGMAALVPEARRMVVRVERLVVVERGGGDR